MVQMVAPDVNYVIQYFDFDLLVGPFFFHRTSLAKGDVPRGAARVKEVETRTGVISQKFNLLAMPFAPSSVLAPSSTARSP